MFEKIAAMAVGILMCIGVLTTARWIWARFKGVSCRFGGHAWGFGGGRACPFYDDEKWCSQPAYSCKRCGAWDYGHEPGPGFDSCRKNCERSFEHDRQTAGRP